jgi:hypothetical protein
LVLVALGEFEFVTFLCVCAALCIWLPVSRATKLRPVKGGKQR